MKNGEKRNAIIVAMSKPTKDADFEGRKDGSGRVRGRLSAGSRIVLAGFLRPQKINAAAAEIIFRARCESFPRPLRTFFYTVGLVSRRV